MVFFINGCLQIVIVFGVPVIGGELRVFLLYNFDQFPPRLKKKIDSDLFNSLHTIIEKSIYLNLEYEAYLFLFQYFFKTEL